MSIDGSTIFDLGYSEPARPPASGPGPAGEDPGYAGRFEYESEWDESAEYERTDEYAALPAGGDQEAAGPENAEWEAFEQLSAATSAPAATFPSGLVLRTTTGAIGEGQEHWDPAGPGRPLYETGAGVRAQLLSANFLVEELVRSGTHLADPARISVDLVRSLQWIRDRLGRPVGVSSGYRSWAYNVALYRSMPGSPTPTKSRHCSGQAADITCSGMTGMDLAKAAIEVLGDQIGVGISDGWAHVDVRGSWSRWSYFSGSKDAAATAEIDAFRAAWKASGRKPTGGAPVPGGPPTSPPPSSPPPTGGTTWGPPRPSAPAPPSGPAQPRSTTFLNTAWSRYSCADKEMVWTRVLSTTTPVNPLTVEAWGMLARALLATGYDAVTTWSYTCRLIANSTLRSLHSMGIALDIDAELNPHTMNTVGPVRFSSAATRAGRAADVAAGRAETVFTPAQVAAVEAIRTVDGLQVFNWGGRWKTSHDTMHFQIDLTPAELARGFDPRTVPAAPAGAGAI